MVDLYIRVSTTEQAMEGYSVAEQEKRLRQYSEAMGYRIYRVHIDAGYSGASLDRPAIREVIRDVKAGMVGKVIVWKLDRLSRSQKDVLIMLEDVFLANGCDFISMMESFDTTTAFGRAIVGILAAFSQLERENIKERTTMGKQARLAQGHYNAAVRLLDTNFSPDVTICALFLTKLLLFVRSSHSFSQELLLTPSLERCAKIPNTSDLGIQYRT